MYVPKSDHFAGDDRTPENRVVETDIPSRLDSLRWSGFHTRVVLAVSYTHLLLVGKQFRLHRARALHDRRSRLGHFGGQFIDRFRILDQFAEGLPIVFQQYRNLLERLHHCLLYTSRCV